jgi:hypothetical protein
MKYRFLLKVTLAWVMATVKPVRSQLEIPLKRYP